LVMEGGEDVFQGAFNPALQSEGGGGGGGDWGTGEKAISRKDWGMWGEKNGCDAERTTTSLGIHFRGEEGGGSVLTQNEIPLL